MSGLGPNATLGCGTESARRRHLAHGSLCSRCFPNEERPAVCPVCADRVTVIADRVLTHDTQGVEGWPCPALAMAVDPLVPVEAPIRRVRLRLVGAA